VSYWALCWLLRKVKDVGRLGRWNLRLYPFKLKVQHTKSVDIVMADSLSRMLEGQEADVRGKISGPLAKSAIRVHLRSVPTGRSRCRSLIEGLRRGEAVASNLRVQKGLLCYQVQRG